jgi:hypothetical protein
MNVQLIANFDVVAKDATIAFPHTGAWYEYFSNNSMLVSTAPHLESLQPGEYRLYTDYPLKGEAIDPVTSITEQKILRNITLYPNPVDDILFVDEAGTFKK